MVKAYITVITAAGTTHEILPQIRDIDGVTEADAVAGDCDIIVVVEAEEPSDLLPTITSRLQGIDGVGTTRTYVTIS